MNKTKMILAGTGGVVGVATLVMAYLIWAAFSAKTGALEGNDETEGLEGILSRARTLSRAPVYPCAASLAEIKSNEAALVEWRAEARKLAIRGDRAYEATTPAKFKTDLVADAKRLSALPGAVNGALVKPGFAFGPFKDYIAEGKMPADAQLKELQRQWDDVATVVEILAQSGVAELVDVQFKAPEAKAAVTKDAKKPKYGNRKQKKGKDAAQPTDEPAAYAYVFTFETRPTGLVKALNALVVSERFITVDDFSFGRKSDTLAAKLGGEDKPGEARQQASGRRGRRRGAAAAQRQEEERKDDAQDGIVSDPLLDAPYTVVMTVTVSDFRSLEETKDEEVKK